jgi:hypothetical protein
VAQGWEEGEQRRAGATLIGTVRARAERFQQESRLFATPRMTQEARELECRRYVVWLELERLAQQMDRFGPLGATTKLAASLHESVEGLRGSTPSDLESREGTPGLYVARQTLRSFSVEGERTILLTLTKEGPRRSSKAEPRVEGLIRSSEQRCDPTVDVRIPGFDDENAAVATDRLVSSATACGTRGGLEDAMAIIVLACDQRHLDSTADLLELFGSACESAP